jgi:hypothetical protein
MASTATTNLRLELMAPGENDDTWGTRFNTVIQLIENALTKRQSVALTNSDVTLSTANFADDQSRALTLVLTGTLTGNVNIIVPSLSHLYLVENNCTGAFSATVKTSAGTGVVVAQGATTILYCNATNVVAPVASATDATTLDGLDSTAFARLAFVNQFAAGNGHTFVTVTDGTTVTVTCSLGDRFIVTLAGNRTLALDSPADGQTIEVWVVQDATGSRTLTYPSNVSFSGGIAPSLSGVANSLDRLRFTYNLARDEWVGEATLSLGAGSTVGLVLQGNEQDVRIFERVGSPAGVVTVNLTLEAGYILSATSTATAALDTSGFASGTVINFTNRGLVAGKGGQGGQGGHGESRVSSNEDDEKPGGTGYAGGPAILGPGSGRTLNVINSAGFVWGGGGGGGGGGATYLATGVPAAGAGGGGGGGAGAGSPGPVGQAYQIVSGVGTSGGAGLSGAGGTGGSGVNLNGASGAGNGGNGGTWGTAGSAGASPTGSGTNVAGGSGGAAGKAVDLNGGTVNFISGSGSPNVMGLVS